MVSEKHFGVLKFLKEILAGKDLNWALTGSTSFALQGLDFQPNDIYIQTDEKLAYKIGEILSNHAEKAVKFSSDGRIRSHFGKFNVKGLEVEVMGDLQKKHKDKWTEPVDINEETKLIEHRSLELPVLKLD